MHHLYCNVIKQEWGKLINMKFSYVCFWWEASEIWEQKSLNCELNTRQAFTYWLLWCQVIRICNLVLIKLQSTQRPWAVRPSGWLHPGNLGKKFDFKNISTNSLLHLLPLHPKPVDIYLNWVKSQHIWNVSVKIRTPLTTKCVFYFKLSSRDSVRATQILSFLYTTNTLPVESLIFKTLPS